MTALELDKDYVIVLYVLDNDKPKQDKILELIPDICKYFSFTAIIYIIKESYNF